MARRSYLGGPQIVEKRPRRRRRCLGCDTVMVTTVSTRLCPRCTEVAKDMLTGTVTEASSVLTLIYVVDTP